MAGERKQQILQTIAALLEEPTGEKITTALLAKKLALSEAALYRHFASKAQMYEGLFAYIEESIFGLCNTIVEKGGDAHTQALGIVGMLLSFAEKNRGLTRILIGEAVVHEDVRLQARVMTIYERLEATLKQCYRLDDSINLRLDSAAQANLLLAFVLGRWQLFVHSGFKRSPTKDWALQAGYLAP
jgi:TetR/AcrR family transcriptional regulator